MLEYIKTLTSKWVQWWAS